MNVLMIADLVAKSGVGKYILSLSEELITYGDNVSVVCEKDELGLTENFGIRHIAMHTATKNPISLFKNVFQLRKIIKANNIDIVHINHRMSGINIWIYNVIFWWDKIPSVWTVHTAPFPGGKLKALMTYHGKYAIAISEEVAEFCQKELKIKESEIVKILNGVDEKKLKRLSDKEREAFKSKYNVSCGQVIVVIHGRIDEVKGIDLVVEAVAKLPRDLRDKLVVVCSGEKTGMYYNVLLQKIHDKNLEKHFRFTGWVSSNQILSIANLVLQPSRREGFPLAAIEAFIMKVPLARTKVGGFKDMKSFVKSIETDNVDDIVDVLTTLIENQNIFDNQVKDAYEFAMNFCTVKKMAESTKQVYNMAVKL